MPEPSFDEMLNTQIPTEDSINVTHDAENSEVSGSVFKELLYRTEVLDGAEFTRIVKAIERMVRTSEEYSTFIYHVHNELGLKTCAVLGAVGSDDDNCTIEVDHYPFTLFDICAAVVNRYIRLHQKFNTMMAAREVMKLHYDMKVGFTCLSKTLHELRHKGKVFINLKQVCGNFMAFAEEYAQDIEPEMIENLSKLMELSKNDAPLNPDPDFLAVRSQRFYNRDEAPKLELEGKEED